MLKSKLKSDFNPEAIYISKVGLYKSLIRMCFFIIALVLLTITVAPTLKSVFMSSRTINTFIIVAFIIGVVLNFRNVLVLIGDTNWINDFFMGKDRSRLPRVISPVAILLKEHRKNHKPYMEAATMESLLNIVESRLEDYKETIHYLAGVLVFLGLLGTFWGLLLTIGSVGDVISGLEITSGNTTLVFETLKQNLSRPLSGMGTAFSTSLFGLGCSLVLGFLQLQTNLAGNFFYNELEENMTRYTRIVSSSQMGNTDGSIITYLQAMLEQTGDNINTLQKTVMKSVATNEEVSRQMAGMAEQTARLATQMQDKLKVMERISVAPEKLYPVLSDLVKISKSGFGMDDKTRNHIRNMDQGLADMTEKLSSDIRLLAKTISLADSNDKTNLKK